MSRTKTNDWWQRLLMRADEVATRFRDQHRAGSLPNASARPLRLGDLEPRLLFSATPIDPAVMAESADSATVLQVEVESASSDDTHADENASIQTVAEPSSQTLSREIIVIDSSVADLQTLLDDLEQNRADADVYVLDSDRDGIEQISEFLEGRTDVASLHIVSHAEDGRIKLGETWLGESNLDAYAGGIASWESSFSSDADILFYGCDLADSASGQTLIDSIGALTGADVAASDDDTGYFGYGGDWQFEYHVGVIESDAAFSVELQNTWQHKLASLTINVDTFNDVVDAGDGVTSLREAIIQANANVGGDTTINLLAGTYTRTLNATGEDNAATGDLDVHEDVTIVGAGSGLTIIDAGYNDRVFDVHDNHLTITDLTLTSGVSSAGGGAVSVNDAAASLTLERVIVTDNGSAEGGAIANLGTINLTDVEISDNGGTGSTVKGGGIYNEGTAILERVTLSGNAAGSGGAIYNDTLTSMSLTNVTISGNTALSSGGAIYNKNSTLTIVNSTITLNNADSGGGLRMQGGTSPTLLNTIVAGNSVASANVDIEGTVSSLGNNLIGDTTGGSGFVGSDITDVSAALDGLADNGGYVQTHALLTGSLAHNAGAVAGASATDARNVTRDASPDIGAFEAAGTTFTVTNTADSGAGSLRQAILDANASVGADTIEFNISGIGVHVIAPTSVLPTITEAVTIDATTDDSFAANGNRPAIVLSGASSVGGSGDGLTLSGTSDGSTIRGLIIRQWSGDGIEIQIGSDNNLIVGNYIGQLDSNGTNAGGGTGNGGNGIVVYGASNQIGGATSADQNIISGNTSAGVYITGSSATDNDVVGNLIGVDSSGVTALGNSVAGVLINAGANGNTIGGEGLGNVISGNTNGVQIFDGGTSSNIVQGNFIGVDATATVAVGNTAQGIQIGSGASNNQIGGDTAAKANVIGGNGTSGIAITGAGTSSNHVQGNYIGTNSTGSLDLGNAIHGVRIQSSAMDNVIGGTGAGEGNVIAFNTVHGVSIVSGATGNALLGNSIYDNDDLAIDLNDDAVTVNDTDDVDSGPNNLMNYPIITSVVQNGADLEIEFGVDLPSGTYRIEFFENPGGVGVDGHGDGQTYLGTTTIVASSVSGGEQFTATLSGVTATAIAGITATATEDRGGGYYGSTSEFSAAFMTAAQFDDSGEVRVNDTTSGSQTTEAETRGSNQAVAVSANGDYVVVWTSNSQDGDGKGVYAQRFNATGVALTGEILVNQTTSEDQQWARVDAADDGSFVVTWTLVDEGDPVDVYARRFGADGTALENEFVVNTYTSGEQHNSSIAVNASGEFIVVWEGEGQTDNDGIFYRRFNADSTAIDAAQVRVNVDDHDSETSPDVAMNNSGQFAVAWQATGNAYVRHYDVDGSQVATPTHNDLMVDTGIAVATGPSIAMDSLGRTVVVYRTPGVIGAGAGVWARTFELSGDQRQSHFEPSDESFSSDNTSPSVDMDDHGNFVVVYHGDSDGDGSGASVKYRIYDEDANALMSAEQVNVTTSGDQQYASISMLDANNFVVVWSGNGNQTDQVDSSGVFSRQFSFAPAVIDLDANDSSASGRNYNATFTIGSGSVVVVDSDATITQGDDANIDSLTVTLDGILDGTDEVLTADTSGTGITASYDDGVLTLSGSDTVANYQQVLRTIAYDNTAGSPTVGSRTLTFHARAGVTLSDAAVTNLTVQTPPNQVPTIDIGGPYTIDEGGTLNLDASGSDDLDGDTLSFAWDLDNDGNYGEAGEPTSETASFDWAALQNLGMGDDGVYTIGLQVDDGNGGVVTTTTTVTVTNVAPTLTVNGSTTISSGAVYYLGLDASDFGDDTISHWTVNWGDGTIETVVGDPSTVSHTYAVSGLTHNITVSATDEDGTWHDSELLVTSSISNSIFRYDAVSGTFLGQFGDGDQTSVGAAVIGPDGLLYVGGFGSNDIERYDPVTGARIDTFVAAGEGGLNQAAGIAFGSDGNLYVASHGTDQVLRFDGQTGDFIDAFIDATGGLDGPIALLFHSDGDLYVSSHNTNRVIRYDGETGAVIGDFVGAANGGLNGPEFMAFGPDGNLYVTSYASDEVYRYDGDTGAYIDTFVGAGVGTLDGPVGIAFGPDGNLYVGSELSNQILRYDGDSGAFIDVYASGSGLNGARDTVFLPTVQVTVTAPPNGGQFWFSTDGSGATSSLPSWSDSTIVELGGSGLSFDTFGTPANTTSGDMSVAFDIDDFASGANVTSLHRVETNLTIGGDSEPAFDLFVGDILFSVDSGYTLTSTNSLSADKEDIVVFRPDAPGDYTSGQFFMLLDNAFSAEVRGITLVEHETTLPDFTLAAGSFLYTRSGGSEDSSIYYYVADDIGDGTTSGTSQVLIDGADIGITDKLIGIELMEQPITVAGMSFTSGQMLLTIDNSGTVGTNALAVDRQDVFYLDVTQTTLGSGSAIANATLLIDGSDIELDNNSEELDAIALFSNNNAPTDITLSNSALDENTDTDGGYSVGTLSATDVDAGEVFTWSVVGGADAALFSIGGAGANELILDDGVLDYENKTAYDVIVSVMDSGGNSFQKPVTVTVSDLNDNAPVVTASQSFDVDEDAANNFSLGTVVATDADSVGSLTNWAITDGNGDGIFAIDASTGELTILDNTNLDRESTANYTLTVQVEDGTNTSSTETIEITVNDVNDNAPVVTASQTFDVNEDAANNFSLGSVVATDADSTGGLTNWAITDGNGDGVFAINASTGELTILDNTNLDRESTASYTLTVQVEDGANTSSTETIEITVNDVNDNAPMVTASQTFDVNEDAANSFSLGSVVATDADSTGSLTNWTITDGNGDGVFAINASTGELTILDNTNLDRESTASYTLTVQVEDGTNTSSTETIEITVNDVNDNAPVVTASQTFDVNEDAANNFSLGSVVATDVDSTGGLTNWTITAGNGDGVFAINASTGELTILDNANLDRESTASYTLTVQVEDGTNTSSTETIEITVNDVNDNAPVVTASQTFGVDEDAANNFSLGSVVATDADSTGGLTNWAITDGNGDGVFAINASTGELTILDNANLDRESTSSYTLTIQIEDGVYTSATETIEITINDVNDNAPVIVASQEFNVDENEANNFSLGSILATDVDSVGTMTNWIIVSGNGDGVFAVNATTGELTVADNSNLDFESTSTYTLGIIVEDGTNTSATQTVSVTVGDVNEAPRVSLTPVVTAIDENTDTSAAIVVATITIDDDDLGSESLALDGADAGAFEIVGNDLRLKAGANLDFETKSSFDVTVTVDDSTLGGTPDDTAAFSLTIADVNDPATGNAVISGSLVEGETLSVDASSISDEDGLNPFAYQWTRDGVNIAGANATTYVLTTDDIGSVIRVAVTYTDGGGSAESILSSPTGVIVAANIAPTLTNYETTGTSNVVKAVPASVFDSLSGDADGDALTAVLVTPPASGNLILLPSGEFTFTPEAGFIGEVTFEWKATDGASDSNVATVTIEFAPVLPPPSASVVTTTQNDSGAENGDNSNSNEEPAETDSESESESDSSESESTSEEEKSSESSEVNSVDPVQSGMRGESQSESRSSDNGQAVNAVEVAIQGQGDGQAKQATTSEALIKQLSESFSEQLTRSSREVAMQASDSPSPLSDYQTRSLVMADFALMTRPGAMWDQLDNYQKDVDSRIHGDLIMVGSAGAAASSFTVGVVAWALRSGFLVSGLIAHMPAWSGVDPLLIMNGLTGSARAGAAGSETLEQLMDRQNREVAQSRDADSSDMPDNA